MKICKGFFDWRKNDSESHKVQAMASLQSSVAPVLLRPQRCCKHTALLNEVFWCVFRDVEGLQSMPVGMMACYITARVDNLTTTKSSLAVRLCIE